MLITGGNEVKDSVAPNLAIPFGQQAIRDRCFHPTGTFVEFKKEEIEQSIVERFEELVCRYANRLAVSDKNGKLTYGELNQAANRVAYTILERQGAGNERVAFLLDQGVTPVIAILGILKAGKTYVPLDPYFPKARIIDMLEDCQTRLILSDEQHLSFARELAKDWPPVLDFSQIKEAGAIFDDWDHSALLYLDDGDLIEAAQRVGEVHIFPTEPTSENLALYAFDIVNEALPEDVKLERLTIRETAKCWATLDRLDADR